MDGFLDRYMNFVQISCLTAILFEIVGIILAGFGNLIGRYLILVPAIVMAVLAAILAIAILIKELFFGRIH